MRNDVNDSWRLHDDGRVYAAPDVFVVICVKIYNATRSYTAYLWSICVKSIYCQHVALHGARCPMHDNHLVFSLHQGAKVPLRRQTIRHRDHQIYGKGRDAAPEAAAGNQTTVRARAFLLFQCDS